jgi:hypothetical protein
LLTEAKVEAEYCAIYGHTFDLERRCCRVHLIGWLQAEFVERLLLRVSTISSPVVSTDFTMPRTPNTASQKNTLGILGDASNCAAFTRCIKVVNANRSAALSTPALQPEQTTRIRRSSSRFVLLKLWGFFLAYNIVSRGLRAPSIRTSYWSINAATCVKDLHHMSRLIRGSQIDISSLADN